MPPKAEMSTKRRKIIKCVAASVVCVIIIAVVLLVLEFFVEGGSDMDDETYNFISDLVSADLDYVTDAGTIAMFKGVQPYEEDFIDSIGKYLKFVKRKVRTAPSTIVDPQIGVTEHFNSSVTVQRSGQINSAGFIDGIGRMQGRDWVSDGFWM